MNLLSFKLGALSALALGLLNSCYFNSAGHLFDKASHESAVYLADITPGSKVYADDSHCYIELPRYRVGAPVVTQYSIFEKEKSDAQKQAEANWRHKTGDTTMVTIPLDFAMYLVGKSDSPDLPSCMNRVDEAPEDVKKRCQSFPIVRTPQAAARHKFEYSSPAAPLWYTLGALEWLCVDFPISCVENCLAGVCVAGMKYTEWQEEAAAKSKAQNAYKFNGYSATQQANMAAYEAGRQAYMNAGNAGDTYYGQTTY